MVVINSILAALRLLVFFTTFTSVTFHDSIIVYQTSNYLALKSKKRDAIVEKITTDATTHLSNNFFLCNHFFFTSSTDVESCLRTGKIS